MSSSLLSDESPPRWTRDALPVAAGWRRRACAGAVRGLSCQPVRRALPSGQTLGPRATGSVACSPGSTAGSHQVAGHVRQAPGQAHLVRRRAGRDPGRPALGETSRTSPRGARIFLPVFADGGKRPAGNLHFGQGDGEITLCGAIEIGGSAPASAETPIAGVRPHSHLAEGPNSLRLHPQAVPGGRHVGSLHSGAAHRRRALHRLACGRSPVRLRSCALTATTIVETLIRMAPTVGGKMNPANARTPAARGMVIRL
jgi:hypothetical protein